MTNTLALKPIEFPCFRYFLICFSLSLTDLPGLIMEHADITKTPEVLLKISKIIETECVQDASFLLSEGFVLLGIGNSIFEDSENRFVYSLGFPKPLAQLSESVLNNF